MNSPMPRGKSKLKEWYARGQGLVEYALILALVAIVVIAVLTSIGLIVSQEMYSEISGGFTPP
ncbi:MAG: Flp family type IVb pilin [Chloroflexia bacterium]